MDQLDFRVSSGLKNIIGRDLITDDFVAVFELVKNSFDAYAKNVTITFHPNTIVIADDGKGMDINDIKQKWLFVAYSAKNEGVEDAELDKEKFKDYRNKIHLKKYFAGAKGIGRFSCDRLGNRLVLMTKKAVENPQVEQIEINWKEFDEDHNKEFLKIKANHETLPPDNKRWKKKPHGTILEIWDLNSVWDREKKRKLKHSLEKVINPFDDDSYNQFSVTIIDKAEEEEDKLEELERNKINGQVKNFVFETLKIKTTQILTEIDENGEFITITLWDRGTLIYKIRKHNDTEPKLSNIKYHLFYLNRIAKFNFKKIMGVNVIDYGSVFLYKNGFRIAPYGDKDYDYFGLDTRKAQKYKDNLGSRELIGRIEINGENPAFKETSSRDGGLVRNAEYEEMRKYFITHCLVKLENYVKIQRTSEEDKDKEDLTALNNMDAKSALIKLLNKELDDETIELIDADRDNLSIRAKEILKDAAEKDIVLLKQIAEKLGDKKFEAETDKIEVEHHKLLVLQKRLQEEEEARKAAEEALKIEREKNLYLSTSSRSLSEDAKGLIHNIRITTNAISQNVDNLIARLKSGNDNLDETLRRLGLIKFHSEKSMKICSLITRSNFKMQQNQQVVDIAKYIAEYIQIYAEIFEGANIKIDLIDNSQGLEKKISILDLSVILDDLISNSTKAHAKKILFELSSSRSQDLILHVSDDGDGVVNSLSNNPEAMFELGVTTTEGSGIGLHSVRNALKAMHGSIHFLGNGEVLQGATFEIKFQKI